MALLLHTAFLLLELLYLVAAGFGFGLLWALRWLFDDRVPASPSSVRQELLAVRTMVRIRRTQNRTMSAMVEEARRQWQSSP